MYQAGRNAAGLLLYVFLVGTLMTNGDVLFGPITTPLLGMMAFLLLFVFSATVCGLLVFGQPIAMYIRGERKEAVRVLGYTVLWIAVFVLVLLAAAAIVPRPVH